MNKQINLRLPKELITKAEIYSKKKGYGNVQDFIKEILREKLYEQKIPSTMLLSEKALAREWNTKEEDEAWKNL